MPRPRTRGGESGTPLCRLWYRIKHRCHNPKHHRYKYYGARGIEVCPEWRESYETFRDYINTHLGERPEGHSLDRINNDGNYEPGNVRWATTKQQNRNSRPSLNRTLPVGVYEHGDKLHSYIAIPGMKKNLHLGMFDTPELAKAAFQAATYFRPLPFNREVQEFFSDCKICRNSHVIEEENSYTSRGRTYCLQCKRESDRRWYLAKKFNRDKEPRPELFSEAIDLDLAA